jgi:gluconate 5-dehydrogenase
VPSLFDLTGRIALVTGSSRGIGLAMARGLAEAGAHVVLNSRDSASLEAAAASLRDDRLAADALAFDVTDGDAVRAAVAHIESSIGPIEILVNNAGMQKRAELHEVDEATFREIIDTNLISAFLVGQAVARRMIERGHGKIINTCSVLSEVGRGGTGPYSSSKGALRQLTRVMCADWARYGIQANGIGPGYVKTELNRPLYENEAFDRWLKARTPAARWGEPNEIAGATVFLASPASDFVNGHILYVDGGLLAVV